jgi:hypothetical protein
VAAQDTLMTALLTIRDAIAARRGLWLLVTFAFVAGYYAFLLVSMSVRFGELPNYYVAHNFFGNAWRIITSTPSFNDIVPIVLDEWLFEVGYMNRHYGRNGIAEWSINIMPLKLFTVFVIGAMVATNLLLLLRLPRGCASTVRYSGLGATGLGAAFVAFTSITVTWVVCCAAPTWVVALALMGLSIPTAFALQPFGGAITVAGFAMLFGSICLLAWRATVSSREDTVVPALALHNA